MPGRGRGRVSECAARTNPSEMTWISQWWVRKCEQSRKQGQVTAVLYSFSLSISLSSALFLALSSTLTQTNGTQSCNRNCTVSSGSCLPTKWERIYTHTHTSRHYQASKSSEDHTLENTKPKREKENQEASWMWRKHSQFFFALMPFSVDECNKKQAVKQAWWHMQTGGKTNTWQIITIIICSFRVLQC